MTLRKSGLVTLAILLACLGLEAQSQPDPRPAAPMLTNYQITKLRNYQIATSPNHRFAT